jgi:hypothetical protein
MALCTSPLERATRVGASRRSSPARGFSNFPRLSPTGTCDIVSQVPQCQTLCTRLHIC